MAYKLNHVSFGYEEKKIFNDLSVTFPDQGLVVILGRSGCGKTTLLSLLIGILKPESGEIEGFGKAKPSIVFQSPLLLDYLTVEENIALPLALKDLPYEKRVKHVIKQVNLVGLENRYPNELSGGQRMRVSLARALISDSPVLILDEPTGQLDEESSLEIYQILKKLSSDHLLILVSHDEKNVPDLADTLFRLENGRLDEIKSNQQPEKSKQKQSVKEKGGLPLRESLRISSRLLKSRKFVTTISTMFLSFIMALVYLGLNLRQTLPNIVDSFLDEYYAREVNTISLKEEIADSGRLHLTKYSALGKADLVMLDVEEAYVPLTYFLPPAHEVTIGSHSSTVSFYPFFHQNPNVLADGRVSEGIQEVIVNQGFLEEFQLTDYSVSFTISSDILIRSISFSASDLISLNHSFQIVGKSKEKKAFNKPCVYYSYYGLYDELKKLYLKNISEELGKLTSVTDLLEDDSYLDDDFMGQARIFLSTTPEYQVSLGKKYFPSRVKITSQALDLKENTSTLLDSLSQVLLLFLGLNLLSAFMLEFLAVYSLYLDNIRYYALLKAFRESKRVSFLSVFTFQFLLLFRILLYLTFFSLLGTLLVNTISVSLTYPRFLTSFSLSSYGLVFLVAVLVSFLASLLPFYRLKDSEIKKELEGED